jgi:hypothetical protein
MTDSIQLTCAETPLAWPATSSPEDLKTCTNCGFYLLTPQPGTLQVLTRRQGGAGDGVNIAEAMSVGAEYRGQRYSYEESIFHTPGLHVFPGQTDVFPAEYHVHMRTLSEPVRYLTLVIPVSHKIPQGAGSVYFAATAAQPDPNSPPPPTLSTLVTEGTSVITYRGPDIRGRTGDDPTPDPQCSVTKERQFLMVLAPVSIRATDLERIPRIGSLSTDPRDLPAPGVKPTATVPRDRLLTTVVLANPGISGVVEAMDPKPVAIATKELECRPVVVQDGQDVVQMGGKAINIKTILGLDGGDSTPPVSGVGTPTGIIDVILIIIFFSTTLVGLLIADALYGLLWKFVFDLGDRGKQWITLKIWFFLIISFVSAAYSNQIMSSFA